MQTYNKFVKYYDEIVRGINSPLHEELDYINSIIGEYKPATKNIFDFACGTGIFSKELIKKGYKVIGLDISEEMLSKARQNIGNHNVIHGDMTSYKLKENFDMVLCNYNSICHLLDFEDWKKTFINAYEHLNKGGLFVFDINTIGEFENITQDFSGFYNFQEDSVCLEMFKRFEHDPDNYGKGTHYEWLIKMFIRDGKKIDKFGNKKYILIEESVKENSFEISNIKVELELSGFEVLKIEDFHSGEEGVEDSERVYFICKKI